MSDQFVLAVFYLLLWLYILVVQVVVYQRPVGRTVLGTLVWMTVLALPFLPFGIRYVSLARYTSGISSYTLRILPFAGLLVSFFLVNRLHFKQNHLVAGAWACVNFLLLVVVVTMADLLPMIKSGLLFHALGYRISIANTFISRMPVLALFAAMALAGFYMSVFERHFLRVPRETNRLGAVSVPAFMVLALMLVIVIMRDDYQRYRYFHYQGGITTVFFAPYDDRQMITFDENRFAIVNGRQSVFYPFGRFSTQDTLRHHAENVLRMKLIEGLDYYRLARIVTVLAHGPRDTIVYKRLRPVITGSSYRIPEQLRIWARFLDQRYASDSSDISVTGWVRVNGSPLAGTEFIVNKVNRTSGSDRKDAVPVWQDRTDTEGRFDFTCYKDAGSDTGYFQVNFSVPDSVFGSNLRTIKVVSPLSVFRQPGRHLLDTLDIVFTRQGTASYRKSLAVATSSRPDSFLVVLPEVAAIVPLRITGAVNNTGEMADVLLECLTWRLDEQSRLSFLEQLNPSRFYLSEPDGDVMISIY